MRKRTTLIFCLISFASLAQSTLNSDNNPGAETVTTKNESAQISESLKNDMAVAFGEKSAERQASELEFVTWGLELNEYLISSGDDFAHAMTLAKILSGIRFAQFKADLHEQQDKKDALNELGYQPMADQINQLIAKPELSAATLEILSSLCFYPELADHCHANVLLEKRMQLDTENLQAYLRPFNLAAQTKSTKLMDQLIQVMAASQHNRILHGLTDEMNALIDDFITKNPIPQSAIDNMIADYRQLSGVSNEKKDQLEQLMPPYMPSFVKSTYQHLNDSPAYRPLLDYCQTHIKAAHHCRKIAHVMIQKSNSIISKGVGHSILIATFELERDQAGIKAATKMNEQFRQSYECIADLVTGPHFIDARFNPDFREITESATDDYEMMIDHAKLRYKNLTAQGDESAVNPDSCFKNQAE